MGGVGDGSTPLNPRHPTMVAALVSVVGVIAFGFGFGRVSGGTKL